MYPLLAIYLQLYGVCASNGIDPSNIAKMLQGREHKITETDRAMWTLAGEAKRLGVGEIFTGNEAAGIRGALAAAGGNAAVWLTKFDEFLEVYGHRTEGIADMNIPSWIEDQTSPLGQLANFIASEEPHDFDAGLAAAQAERDEVVEQARSSLDGAALGAFNELLAINQVANFAWWNEEHNYYIDLRATIPMRTGALAISSEVGSDTYDDALFLFFPELIDVCEGKAKWADLQSMVTERHDYYDGFQSKRSEMPKVVGTLPDKIEDPVLIEIFGMHSHYFEGLKADIHTTELKGFPASAGIYTGQRAGDGVGDGTVRARGGRDPRHRGDLAELDAGVRHHRRLRVRRRRLAHPRRHRVARVRHSVRGRHLGGDTADQDRRHDRGRRHQGNGEDPRTRRRLRLRSLAAGQLLVDERAIRPIRRPAASAASTAMPSRRHDGEVRNTGTPTASAAPAAAVPNVSSSSSGGGSCGQRPPKALQSPTVKAIRIRISPTGRR